MTTVQISLPDELAQKADSAGLLSPAAIEGMLREQLRRRAGEGLRQMWERGPQDELSQQIEQDIVRDVGQVRADLNKRRAG